MGKGPSTAEAGDFRGEVGAGLLLEAGLEIGGLEEWVAVEEGEDLVHALAEVFGVGEPVKLLAEGVGEVVELVGAGAEPGEVEVGEEVAVLDGGAGEGVGDADEVVDDGSVLVGDVDGGKEVGGEAGGLEFVVFAARVVDDVVEVEGEAEMGGVVGGGGEEIEAEGEVGEGVKVAVGFRVPGLEGLPDVAVRVLGLEEGKGLDEVFGEVGHQGEGARSRCLAECFEKGQQNRPRRQG